MTTLQDVRKEILAICEKHNVKLEVMYVDYIDICDGEAWIEVVYNTDEVTGSTKLYDE